jgi:hypothetical protein
MKILYRMHIFRHFAIEGGPNEQLKKRDPYGCDAPWTENSRKVGQCSEMKSGEGYGVYLRSPMAPHWQKFIWWGWGPKSHVNIVPLLNDLDVA